ncbi:MAG: sulfotransferase, partial [Dyella sp.]
HQILKHCSLNWEDDCFQFEKNQAPVATASAIQVREPIYRAAIDRWKRYGSQLDELRQLLASSGIGGL